MYIGVDMIEVKRVSKLVEHDTYILNVFTQNELNIVHNYGEIKRIESLAGKFAAKEATVKALGTGFDNKIMPKDIEVLNNENGKPILRLHNAALEMALKLGIRDLNISISHNKTTAISFVTLT
ncbi:holo-ACP synthase [Chengkuizengella sp. SCS-71B]|uniref:holo-ACP synthase n=1 Tax=Chengkuizengella sp. SCS-71B TaxID=3115290 RepID=UPI0032C20DAA